MEVNAATTVERTVKMRDDLKSERYEITHTLAASGATRIYACKDHKTDRQVVVKALALYLAKQNYIEREFDILVRLSHPNIVQVFEKFELDGRPCFAMEKLDGAPFMQAIGSPCGATLGKVAASAFSQLQNALDYLHDNKVVHAELSPGNLLVDEVGTLRIVDFEHARLLGANESEFWPEDALAGTPLYMSPEHLTGDLIPQSDYFVVGTLLAEALTGKNPFSGPDLASVLEQISAPDEKSIFTTRPDHDPELQDIIARLLAREVAEREAGWELLRAFTS